MAPIPFDVTAYDISLSHEHESFNGYLTAVGCDCTFCPDFVFFIAREYSKCLFKIDLHRSW